MKYLVTVQAYREEPGFFEKESQKPRMILIDEYPYDWWVAQNWANIPEFAGYNRLNILNVIPEKPNA